MEITARIFRSMALYVGWILAPIYYLYSFTKTGKLPAIKQPDIIHLSATSLAKKIRNKQIKSEAVIQAYIERIRDVNPLLNAVVEDRFAAALEEAKKVDQLILQANKTPDQFEKESPLLGVPITVKESCSVAGMSYCVGSKLRIGNRAEEDGAAVANMKNAGAIPLLVSNTPELCGSIETVNNITGYTANPYDQHYSIGGSSGGEAALVSSGASVLGIGSDFAGSIRLPCLFGGIFGHKPTPGIIPTRNHYPSSEDKEFQRLLTLGPMVRYAEDLKLAIKIMAGPMVDILNLDKEINMKDLKVYYATDFGFSLTELSVNQEIKRRITDTAQYFSETYGCPIAQIQLKELEDIFEICLFQLTVVEDGEKIINLKGENDSSPYVELVKWMCNMSDYGANIVIIKVLMKNLLFMSRRKSPKYMEKRDNLQRTITDLLADNGVLIIPTFPQPAHCRRQLIWKLGSIGYAMVVNILGLPATHVPTGLSKNGLPIGFQVVAGPKQDRLCLAVAEEMERVYGGWIPPPCSKSV